MKDFYLILFLLQLKHFIADFILQTDKIALMKGKNFKYLIWHSFHHSFLTFIVLFFFFRLSKILVIFFIELIIHSLIDYLKANEKLGGKYKFPAKLYFILFGFDQLLHNWFYILIITYLINN